MFVIELLATNTIATVTKFLLGQVAEHKKSKGKDKEIETLVNKLEVYSEKTELMDRELAQFKEMAEKLEIRLGSGHISENAYVNWSLDTIKPEKSVFKIEVWTEKGDFQGARDIAIVPETKIYKTGDKINLYFRSEKDCYLTLINYGTSGKLTVLLPNSLSQDNLVKGSRIYAIPGQDYPFDYVLSGPPGIEKIKAIGTTRKINLTNLTYNKGEIFPTSHTATRDISIVAKKIENAAPNEWAEALCEIEVV